MLHLFSLSLEEKLFKCLRGGEGLIFINESPLSIIVTRYPNWSVEIYGKRLIILKERYYHLKASHLR